MTVFYSMTSHSFSTIYRPSIISLILLSLRIIHSAGLSRPCSLSFSLSVSLYLSFYLSISPDYMYLYLECSLYPSLSFFLSLCAVNISLYSQAPIHLIILSWCDLVRLIWIVSTINSCRVFLRPRQGFVVFRNS